LDSKEPEDQPFIATAPRTVDCLSDSSRAHFDIVQQGLKALGIPFEITPTLVRGLDYYTHTVFEIHGANLGAQSQVIGGGRFDGLIERMGGDAVPAVGWGCGVERLEMMLPALKPTSPDIGLVMDGKTATRFTGLGLARKLRKRDLKVVVISGESFKTQFKNADKSSVKWALVLGENEMQEQFVTLKCMKTGEETKVGFAELNSFNFQK
jgi:histidyl-tRNA synthetase